ncbi:MAG: hypothetical protein A2017_17125 [Lentisphaerae bacterium GWF2_44_16]|nr:MAG: hypothetical protein A2017_17125 [Lentisphaerae bacterium GWF2_44_16]
MRIKLTGRYLEDIKPFLESGGFELVEEAPELIITHGGDGTMLGSEREFPGIPKFPIRDRRTAPLCPEHDYEKQIEALRSGRLKKTELMKLAGISGSSKLSGMNDIFIHNKDRVSAVRYRVWINNVLYAEEIVGDGAGVATVHGSTAYYRSITHSVFRVGIGLAFSNSTEVTNHMVLPEDSIIKILILRGPAIMVADNSSECIDLNQGDEITIVKIPDQVTVYGLDMFMCQKCRRLRYSHKYKLIDSKL